MIPHRFKVDLPDDLIMEVVKAKDNDAVKQIGIEWCITQSKELVKAGIPVLHYYSMGKAENVKAIAKEIFRFPPVKTLAQKLEKKYTIIRVLFCFLTNQKPLLMRNLSLFALLLYSLTTFAQDFPFLTASTRTQKDHEFTEYFANATKHKRDSVLNAIKRFKDDGTPYTRPMLILFLRRKLKMPPTIP
jgi:hypothetical protein